MKTDLTQNMRSPSIRSYKCKNESTFTFTFVPTQVDRKGKPDVHTVCITYYVTYLVLFLALAEEISIRHDCKVINPQKSKTIVPSISPHCDIQKGIAKMPTPITELIRLTMWGTSLSISPSEKS